MDTYERGSNNSAYGCRYVDPCTSPPGSAASLDVVTFANGTTGPLQKTISGHRSKVNLSWKPAAGMLVYATYSEGFRPGGFNRGQGIVNPQSPFKGKLTISPFFDTDTLKNYELGWKTSWLDRRVQFNGAVYEEHWNDVQLSIFDPSLWSNQIFTANGPSYRVRGFEGELVMKATRNLTIMSSFAWNSSSQVNAPSIIGDDGSVLQLFPTPGIGSSLAQAPPFQGNIRARYEFSLGDFDAHWQVAMQHTAHSYASVITVGAFEPGNQNQAPYTTYDAGIGISSDVFDLELYGQNLTDTRAQVYENGFDFVHLVTPNRPRTVGVRASYHFKGGSSR